MIKTASEIARLTTDIALFGEQDDEVFVLTIRRRWPPYPDWWALPGGRVRPGETTFAASRRQLAEDTGLHVGNLGLVQAYADPGRDPRGRYVTCLYTARVPGLPTPTPGADTSEACWTPVAKLLTDPRSLAFDHHRLVHDALLTHSERNRPAANEPTYTETGSTSLHNQAGTGHDEAHHILDQLIGIFGLDDNPGKLIRNNYVTSEADRLRWLAGLIQVRTRLDAGAQNHSQPRETGDESRKAPGPRRTTE